MPGIEFVGFAIAAMLLAILGAGFKIFWNGLKGSVIQTVVNEGVADILRDIRKDITDIKTGLGMNQIADQQLHTRIDGLRSELEALRNRYDAAVDEANKTMREYDEFKRWTKGMFDAHDRIHLNVAIASTTKEP